MIRLAFVLAFALAALGLILPAAAAASPIAEVVCAPTAEMTRRLETQFGATRSAVGVRDAEQVMEIWTSPVTDGWTMVSTYANGNSCIVAMGHDWTVLTPESPT